MSTDRATGHRWTGWLGITALGCLAAAVRLVGLGWGVPNVLHRFSYHPDEWQVVETALRMVRDGDINPHFFNYPSLQVNLAAALFRVLGVSEAGDVAGRYLCARSLTAAMGVGTVLLMPGLGAALGSRRAGLLAAALLAVLPLHAIHSHFATVDVPLAFWSVLAVLLATRLAAGPSTRRDALAVAAGLAAGLAAGTKYNGAAVIVPVIAGILIGGGRASWPTAVVAALAGVGAFLVSSPYLLLDPAAWPAVRFELFEHPRQTGIFGGVGPGWWFHLGHNLPTATGYGFALVAAVGLVLLARERNRAVWPLLLWAALCGLAMLRTRELFIRYWLPLLPVLCLAATWAIRAAARRPVLAVALLLLAAAEPGLRSRAYVAMMARPDARDQAARWCFANLPAGDTVGIDGGPWFWSVPLQPNNGGARTRSAATRGRYRLIPEPEQWLPTAANWIVVNRAAFPGWAAKTSCPPGYEPVARFDNRAHVLPGWTESGADDRLHDWNYVLPSIQVYRRRQSPRMPTERRG